MVRVTNAVSSRRRRKRIRKKAKGYWGDRKNHLRVTKDAVMRALVYNYEHRKQKKRNFRRLWITRISAAAKENGISYSKLMHASKLAKSYLDRKLLADMAINVPLSFTAVAATA